MHHCFEKVVKPQMEKLPHNHPRTLPREHGFQTQVCPEHTLCLLPTYASVFIKRVTCNHKMWTNAEFQLLLSQQTIQQSILNNTISHATFAKAKFKQRTNWLNSYEWRRIGSAWTNGTRLHAKSTWTTYMCSQMWIMSARAMIQSHRFWRRPSRSGHGDTRPHG